MEEDLIEAAERVLRAAIRDVTVRPDSATVRDLCAATASLERAKFDQINREEMQRLRREAVEMQERLRQPPAGQMPEEPPHR